MDMPEMPEGLNNSLKSLVQRDKLIQTIKDAPESAQFLLIVQAAPDEPLTHTFMFAGINMCLERSAWMLRRVTGWIERLGTE